MREQHRVRGFLALVAAGLPIALLLAFPRLDLVLPAPHFVAIHSLLEMLVVVVCFGTFAVQWYAAGARAGEARARFLGAAFLGVALLESAHLLAYPGMTAFGIGSTGRGIWYWLAARLWTVAALLAAVAIRPAGGGRLFRRRTLVAAVLVLVAALVLVETVTPSLPSLFYEDGAGLTPLKKGMELAVMVLSAVTGLLYLRLHRRTGDRAAPRIAVALALTVLSELCFMLYASAFDLFNLLGHVYLALAFALIFDALFVSTLLRPYAELEATSRELSASNAELRKLREHVENELAVTIERLKRVQQLQDDLLHAVSHDVRTPLQVIMLQAEKLRSAAGQLDSARDVGRAQIILENARRIGVMVRDLVDAAQLERGGLKLDLEMVRVHDLVKGLLSGSAGVLDTSRVRVELPPDLPPVRADPSRLERILANLIGNALKHSEPGSTVQVDAAAAESEIRIAVSDRGPGIPAEDLPHIFDRFYRGRRASGDGLGLGLHIARLLAKAHGGDVSAESRAGTGSTFAVRLPLGGRPADA